MMKEQKTAAKLAEEKGVEEAAFRAELKKLELEQQKRDAKVAEAKARGKKRAIEELAALEAEEQAYKKQMDALKLERERKEQKEMQARMEQEALQEIRAERLAKQKAEAEAKRKEAELRAKEAADAKERRAVEYKEMMSEYEKKEIVHVTDDGAEWYETVAVSKTQPLAVPAEAPVEAAADAVVTVTTDEGMTHSYPKRDFKPEQPKKDETVTLKTSGEIHDGTGRVADKAVLAGLGLAMTASMVLMMTRKFRSPVAAPEAGVALTSRMATTDLEDPEPIAAADELAQSWASSAVEKALAAAEAK